MVETFKKYREERGAETKQNYVNQRRCAAAQKDLFGAKWGCTPYLFYERIKSKLAKI